MSLLRGISGDGGENGTVSGTLGRLGDTSGAVAGGCDAGLWLTWIVLLDRFGEWLYSGVLGATSSVSLVASLTVARGSLDKL